jgi:hypothetical protein
MLESYYLAVNVLLCLSVLTGYLLGVVAIILQNTKLAVISAAILASLWLVFPLELL